MDSLLIQLSATDVQIPYIELFFHFLILASGIVATCIAVYVWHIVEYKPFKIAFGYYVLSLFFMMLRAVGGSLARLHVPFTYTLFYNFVWTLSGVFAFFFAICGSWFLVKWLRGYSFRGVKK